MTTPEWRAIDDASPLIEYNGNWQSFSNVDLQAGGFSDLWARTYHSTTQSKSSFFVQFHGDGIDFWSHVYLGDSGQYILQLDGKPAETVSLNVAEPNPRLPIWQKSGLDLGDHDLVGVFVGTASGGKGYLDSFAVHNSQYATDGFDLKSVGPAASDVPSNAIVVDDKDPTVFYTGQWTHGTGILFYQQTTSLTTTPGDSFTFHFTGTAIWYYTDLNPAHAPVSISIDGGTPDIAQSTGTTGFVLSRRLIWSRQGLSNTLHTLTATHIGSAGQAISLDFFRVLGSASAAPLLSSGNSGSTSSSNGVQGTAPPGGSATIANASGSSTASGTTQTSSGSLNHTSTDGAFKATFIIPGASTGASPDPSQTARDGITVTSTQDQQQQNPSNNTSVIIGSAFGAAALVIFAVGCLLWYRRRNQIKQMSLSSSPLDPAEPNDTSRLDAAISAKRNRFLASEASQISSLPTRDMEQREGGLGITTSNTSLALLRDGDASRLNAPSIAASHAQQSTSAGSQEELYLPLSLAPPPYER